MDCLDCGKSLDMSDLAAGSCQGCGEPLLPDDIKNLEAKLSIVKEVPEVEAPVLVPEGGIKIPDVLICKNPQCGFELYGDEIKSYMNGGDCNYCNTPDPDAVAKQSSLEPVVDAKSNSELAEISEPISQSISTPENGILVRLCTGPLVGHGVQFKLPTDKILGREFFKEILDYHINDFNVDALAENTIDEKWYAKSISRISREHFKISEDGTIEDMGSANSTFLDREEVFGEGDSFELGMVLSIADELMLTRVHSQEDGPGITIKHAQTGISIDVPSGKKFHLGRLREDGRREPFGFAIADHMNRMDGMDHGDLRRISRRHAFVEFLDNTFYISNLDGKPVEIYDWDGITTMLDSERTSVDFPCAYDGNIRDAVITLGKMNFEIRSVKGN